MDEAYRVVALCEGDQVIKLPAIQAVFRAMGVSAMKGNRFAQRTFAELVQQVENSDCEYRAEYLKTMMEYKCDGERAIEDAKFRGITPPDPIPHPDDIIIDFASSSATINGPLTKEDKAAWDRMLNHRDNLQLSISDAASAYARARVPTRKAEWLDEWKREQRLYDKLNDNLPKRYRKTLMIAAGSQTRRYQGARKIARGQASEVDLPFRNDSTEIGQGLLSTQTGP
jgi:hypothetical protein